MIEIKMDKIQLFRKAIGSFAIIDYNTINGSDTAKGRLISISDSGDVVVEHLYMETVFWGFHIDKVTNYKFSPIKDKDKDGKTK